MLSVSAYVTIVSFRVDAPATALLTCCSRSTHLASPTLSTHSDTLAQDPAPGAQPPLPRMYSTLQRLNHLGSISTTFVMVLLALVSLSSFYTQPAVDVGVVNVHDLIV